MMLDIRVEVAKATSQRWRETYDFWDVQKPRDGYLSQSNTIKT